ncbi:hypothetical protein [Mycolicibacterium vinylchloridicum]|uniref:hypothetical protein n=1 Tax=Mycolicibacterium vinylchloridicum TaxID=2736928 RepID=UPI0015CE3E78|nr:hypothetical protein [Mycolicibacterium vinylchloridicum]
MSWRGRSVLGHFVRPLRGGVAALSLALATMVLAATHPQAVSTPVVGLAALVFGDVTTNPAGDAMVDIFDYKILQPGADNQVLSIGGGSDDAATLAELLDSTDPSNNVFHVNYEFDARAKVQVLTVFTDSNALAKHDSKQTVDQAGGVNCTGATICHTDPRSGATTITYPDGVVAVVERINDIAVVAYKTLGAAVLGHLKPPPVDAPTPQAAAPPLAAADPAPAAADPVPAPADAPAAAGTGPRLNVVRPAPDFTPGRSGATTTSPGAKSDLSDATDKFVNDVLDKVSDTVNHIFNRDNAPSGVGNPGTPPPAAE